MKKIFLLIIPLCCAVLLAAAVWARGSQPLKDLTAAEIERVDVELFPCGPDGPEFTLTREEIGRLLPLLNQVTTRQRDDSWGEHDGGLERFHITRIDGTRLEVTNYGNLFFIVDGESRRADYRPLSQLNDFIRRLRD